MQPMADPAFTRQVGLIQTALGASIRQAPGQLTVVRPPVGVKMTDCNMHAEGRMVNSLLTTAFFQCVDSRLVGQCDRQTSSSPRSIAWKRTSPTRVSWPSPLYSTTSPTVMDLPCTLAVWPVVADSADARPNARSAPTTFGHACTASGKHGFSRGSSNECM